MEGFVLPRRQPPQSGGLSRRKIFFTFFYFARAGFFLLKGKENFSARLRALARAAGLRFGSDGAGRRVWEKCPRRPRPIFDFFARLKKPCK